MSSAAPHEVTSGAVPAGERSGVAGMKEIWTGRVGQLAGKYGENAPTAAVCCNACRTCVTTNAVGIAIAAVGAVAAGVLGFASRRLGRTA
jgi:hypothetical protein